MIYFYIGVFHRLATPGDFYLPALFKITVMTPLEQLQAESRERRRLQAEMQRLSIEKKKLELQLIKQSDSVGVKRGKYKRKPKLVIPAAVKPEVVIQKVKEFNKKSVVVPKKEKVYESAFTYPEDAHRQQRHPSKYSNRNALNDYL